VDVYHVTGRGSNIIPSTVREVADPRFNWTPETPQPGVSIAHFLTSVMPVPGTVSIGVVDPVRIRIQWAPSLPGYSLLRAEGFSCNLDVLNEGLGIILNCNFLF
jgi:hypothetical protein